RAHAYEHFEPFADSAIERTVADPVYIAQYDAMHLQRLARTDDHTAVRGIELHDVKRRVGGDAKTAALSDSEMHDAVVAADNATIEIDDVAGLHRVRL